MIDVMVEATLTGNQIDRTHSPERAGQIKVTQAYTDRIRTNQTDATKPFDYSKLADREPGRAVCDKIEGNWGKARVEDWDALRKKREATGEKKLTFEEEKRLWAETLVKKNMMLDYVQQHQEAFKILGITDVPGADIDARRMQLTAQFEGDFYNNYCAIATDKSRLHELSQKLKPAGIQELQIFLTKILGPNQYDDLVRISIAMANKPGTIDPATTPTQEERTSLNRLHNAPDKNLYATGKVEPTKITPATPEVNAKNAEYAVEKLGIVELTPEERKKIARSLPLGNAKMEDIIQRTNLVPGLDTPAKLEGYRVIVSDAMLQVFQDNPKIIEDIITNASADDLLTFTAIEIKRRDSIHFKEIQDKLRPLHQDAMKIMDDPGVKNVTTRDEMEAQVTLIINNLTADEGERKKYHDQINAYDDAYYAGIIAANADGFFWLTENAQNESVIDVAQTMAGIESGLKAIRELVKTGQFGLGSHQEEIFLMNMLSKGVDMDQLQKILHVKLSAGGIVPEPTKGAPAAPEPAKLGNKPSLGELDAVLASDKIESKKYYLDAMQEAIQVLDTQNGIVQIADGNPNLVIPDLHARPGMLEYILSQPTTQKKADGSFKTHYDLLAEGKLNVTVLGDVLHSDRGYLWSYGDFINYEHNPDGTKKIVGDTAILSPYGTLVDTANKAEAHAQAVAYAEIIDRKYTIDAPTKSAIINYITNYSISSRIPPAEAQLIEAFNKAHPLKDGFDAISAEYTGNSTGVGNIAELQRAVTSDAAYNAAEAARLTAYAALDEKAIRKTMMDLEMKNNMKAMQMIWVLTAKHPNFKLIAGNHDDVGGEVSGQTKRTGSPTIGESKLVENWAREQFGDDFFEEWKKFAKKLPVIAKGKNIILSHTTPEHTHTKDELMKRPKEVMKDLTWSRGTNYDAVNAIRAELGEPDNEEVLWFVGHDTSGDSANISVIPGSKVKVVNIDNDTDYLWAVVPTDRPFDDSKDVHFAKAAS